MPRWSKADRVAHIAQRPARKDKEARALLCGAKHCQRQKLKAVRVDVVPSLPSLGLWQAVELVQVFAEVGGHDDGMTRLERLDGFGVCPSMPGKAGLTIPVLSDPLGRGHVLVDLNGAMSLEPW